MNWITGYRKEFYGKTLNLLMVLLVFSSVIYFFSFITADPDLWGHIMFGKEILTSKAFLRLDIYSYTAYGMEWINHEWLSELIMYSIFNAFGSQGLLVGKTIIGLVIVTALSFICFNRKNRPLSYGIVFVMCVFIMSPGFMTRPQLMTFLFAALFLLVFHLYFEKSMNLLWALPFIMILWVNSHGGFLIGLGIFPVIVVCEIISRLIERNERSNLRNLILWLILTEASVLINPYGLGILTFLYESLSLPRSISEWAPIGIFDLSYLRLKILAILTVIALFTAKKKNRPWEIGIIAIAMLYAFLHQRHTPIFAIFTAPFLSEKLSELEQVIELDKRIQSLTSYIVLSIFVLMLVGYQISYAASKYIKTGFNIIVDPLIYPVRAVHFLKENKINGNILLPFEWGEYVIWKLYPDSKVSIDGRFRTVYPESVLDDHLRILNDPVRYRDVLDKYPTDILLVRRNPIFQNLINTKGKWIYVYSDSNSIIFIKKSDSMQGYINKIKKKEIAYPNQKISIYFP
ncbi:hypothetical protein OAC89_00385 [Deltaproteobacteria bacterium]|nr:hypothetical protein [Deltaproteobacteria bacterium]